MTSCTHRLIPGALVCAGCRGIAVGEEEKKTPSSRLDHHSVVVIMDGKNKLSGRLLDDF